MRCGVNCEAALQPPGHGQSLPSAASADFYAAVFSFDPMHLQVLKYMVEGDRFS
jgi:hypothetical protein